MTQQEFFERFIYDHNKDLIGSGTFGKVYKAYDKYEDNEVAIKRSEVNPDLEKFSLRNEVELAKTLPSHPNIAKYIDCHRIELEHSGTYDFGILMYYPEGNLSDLLKDGKVNSNNIDDILLGILEGIKHLHNNKITHRDLKPGNILIFKRDNHYIPKIADFGISKQVNPSESSFIENSLTGGTLAYSSPEQFLGERRMRKNTDLWSFGVIAYWLNTGKLPFNTGDYPTNSEAGRAELSRQIKIGKLPDDIQKIQNKWKTVIEKCLVVDYNLRAQSAEDLLEILHGKTTTTKTPPTVDNSQSIDKTKIETKNDEITIQLADDKTIVEKSEFETKDEKKQGTKKEPLPENKNKKNKFLIPSLIFGVLLAVVLFVWQPWKSLEPTNRFENFTETVDGVEIEMIAVEGGTFTMGCTSEEGSDCYDSEKPAHSVTLSSYYIGKYEVTQGQWKAVMGSNPSASDKGIGDNYPVNNVSWNDIQAFITKLNQMTGQSYRLPTEAEWEFAARGGNSSNGYKYSGSNTIGNVAWYADNSANKTHPVGQKSPNELGIYDMSGNVFEWCSNWFKGYPGSSGVSDYTGSRRVLRGGSWYADATVCRVSDRRHSPDPRDYAFGFRLVLVP